MYACSAQNRLISSEIFLPKSISENIWSRNINQKPIKNFPWNIFPISDLFSKAFSPDDMSIKYPGMSGLTHQCCTLLANYKVPISLLHFSYSYMLLFSTITLLLVYLSEAPWWTVLLIYCHFHYLCNSINLEA